MDRKQPLTNLPIGNFMKIMTANTIVTKIIMGIPKKSMSFGTSSSLINLVIPKPAAMLNIFEPMILPSAISILR